MSPVLTCDAAHGGRIVSLVDRTGFEWLWSRPDQRRYDVAPTTFVDVGGVEECFPTIAGSPDHGEAWSQPWTHGSGGYLVCRGNGWVLSRREHPISADTTRLEYGLEGPPGMTFVWAFHALVRPDPDMSVDVPTDVEARTWPDGHSATWSSWLWPLVAGCRADDLSVDDGTATFILLPDLARVAVRIGDRSLGLRLDAGTQPHGFGIWRNLGGYCWDGGKPYRSLGIEPMLGRAPDRATAPRSDLARIPSAGTMRWSLDLTLGAPGSSQT